MLDLITRARFVFSKIWWVSGISLGAEVPTGVH